MKERLAGRVMPSEERRVWRLLLARLHPDAGGDHELFLFACALRDEVCRARLFGSGHHRSATDQSFSAWRRTMGSWASSNRDALSRHRWQRIGRMGDPTA